MAYQALELGQPGNAKCPDRYSEESTLLCPGCNRLGLQISKQAVMVQLGVMPQGIASGVGGVQWLEEKPYLPIVASLGRSFDAVRVRNYTKGAEAQIFVHAEAT